MSDIPYFGRAWQIALVSAQPNTDDPGDNPTSSNKVVLSSTQTNGLRVIFKVDIRALLAYWTADVEIYNVNAGLATQLHASPGATQSTPDASQLWSFLTPIVLGDSLSISAGYKVGAGGVKFNPSSNLIYQGNIFQPMWTRENVTDWKITLRCTIGYQQNALGNVSFTSGENQTQLDILQRISTESGIPIDTIDDGAQQALTNSKIPGHQIINARPFAALRDVADETKMQLFVGPKGINVRSFKFDPNTTPNIVYAPPNLPGVSNNPGQGGPPTKNTLLGVPNQTQDGIVFRVLLDGQVKLGDIVKVPLGTAINRLPIQIGKNLPPAPNQTGLYVVAGLRHYGDTRGRGDDWYTEITGMTAGFFPTIFGPTTPNVTG